MFRAVAFNWHSNSMRDGRLPITRLEITIAAKVSGDTMQGTVDFGGAAQDEFSAKRAPAPARSP